MPFHPDQLLLYAVTDRAWTGRQTLLEQLEAALQGGVTLVQLREKDLDPAAFLAEALEVKALCHRYHVPLILNDQVDLALACGADGVHVGSEDPALWRISAGGRDRTLSSGPRPKPSSRPRPPKPPGPTTWGWGPFSPPPPSPAPSALRQRSWGSSAPRSPSPRWPSGGIGPSNLAQLKGSGAAGIAVVSSLFGAEDIQAAAQALARQARQVLFPHPIP